MLAKAVVFILLASCVAASADTDRVAPATYFHTKVVLPPPHGTGEVIAEANYDRKDEIVRFRTLTVKIGKWTIKVPKRILNFYLGPRLTSLELFSGPPSSRGSRKPEYFNITFKYESYAYESLYQPPDGPTGWIIIRDGVITDLHRVEERADGGYDIIDYDPKTLKKIIRKTR